MIKTFNCDKKVNSLVLENVTDNQVTRKLQYSAVLFFKKNPKG